MERHPPQFIHYHGFYRRPLILGHIKAAYTASRPFIWLALGVNFFELENGIKIPLFYAFGAGAAAFVTFNAVALFVKWQGLKISYTAKENSCFGLTRFDWNKTIYNAKRIGIVLAVGMILFGVYYYLKDFAEVDVHFVTRAVIVLFLLWSVLLPANCAFRICICI